MSTNEESEAACPWADLPICIACLSIPSSSSLQHHMALMTQQALLKASVRLWAAGNLFEMNKKIKIQEWSIDYWPYLNKTPEPKRKAVGCSCVHWATETSPTQGKLPEYEVQFILLTDKTDRCSKHSDELCSKSHSSMTFSGSFSGSQFPYLQLA